MADEFNDKAAELLEGRELDAAVARRVMGWTVQRRGTGNLMAILPDDSRLCIEHVNGVQPATLWNPSEDIAAAFQIENRIEELGLQVQYIQALAIECGITLLANVKEYWTVLRATPEQRCRAALKASGKEMASENHERFRDAVLEEAKKGNIVFMAMGEPMVANLDEFIKQPAEGILYDLNRSREVVLAFIDDPKWVNDYAVALVISKLKAELDAARAASDANETGEGEG